MLAFFRFAIIASTLSALAGELRSVRKTMLRRSIFFPLKRKTKTQPQSHWWTTRSELWETGGFLLSFCLKEIHADNKSIKPWWTVVKDSFYIQHDRSPSLRSYIKYWLTNFPCWVWLEKWTVKWTISLNTYLWICIITALPLQHESYH